MLKFFLAPLWFAGPFCASNGVGARRPSAVVKETDPLWLPVSPSERRANPAGFGAGKTFKPTAAHRLKPDKPIE